MQTIHRTSPAWDDLELLRQGVSKRATQGLDDETLAPFLEEDSNLRWAIRQARQELERLDAREAALRCVAEDDLCDDLQEDYLNFYGATARSPYVPLAARGPWIVTLHGAVIHDSGGYGMLGLGHVPPQVVNVLAEPWVMANVMTPSLSQKRLAARFRREIGNRRGDCPYERFLCLNSGSESVTMAARVTDLHAYRATEPGARHAGKEIRYLSLEGSFHGRTDPAARISEATRATYEGALASFRDRSRLTTIPANDVVALEAVFASAETNGVFFEGMFIEPVMGEGEPGLALTPEFYEVARRLTRTHGALLVCDSIQAGLRATGHLSIVDYPGFENLDPPDMETFSKALNAGQYPLSVLALTGNAANEYVPGVYGNTMTTCPRGLEVGCAVLESITDDLRENIRLRGAQLLSGLGALADEFPDAIASVRGTGLIVNVELDPARFPVNGSDGLEEILRRRGIHMIHGGHNGLRFTPHFEITESEVDLILEGVRSALRASS